MLNEKYWGEGGTAREVKSISTSLLVSSIGFALFLTINATQVWGGLFPFLPQSFQTEQVTLVFYLGQSIAFALAFLASTVGSYYFPEGASHMLVGVATALVMAGSVLTIAAMYVPTATMVLVFAGGVLSGVGSAAFFMLWQRYFASLEQDECNNGLLVGTILGAVFYFALYLIPTALTAFLIPTVLLPVGALCLAISVRHMDFDQPMFQDIPREHPQVYRRLGRDLWRAAVSIAAIGFSCGLARGVAVSDVSIGNLVNVVSMTGSLAAAAILLLLSRSFSIRFGLNRIFRLVFPVVMVATLVFPFLQDVGLGLFAGLIYLVFSLIVLVMMMQSAQICRDRGVNPVFVYGFFGVAIYTAQSIGFLMGWIAETATGLALGETAMLSLAAAFAMGMALFAINHGFAMRPFAVQRENEVEFIIPERKRVRMQAASSKEGLEQASSQPQRTKRLLPEADEATVTDRLSKQCLVARAQFGLSTREAEVMELIARGRTVAAIAEELFISENTVRTHSKHIYTKLDIHSKGELSQLLDTMDLAELSDL